MKEGKADMVQILDPALLSDFMVGKYPDVSLDYLCRAMHQAHQAGKKLILLPYHQG